MSNVFIQPVADLPATLFQERRIPGRREMLLRRIHTEFKEMPGLSVTLEQATKLFGLPSDASGRILGELVTAGVLSLDAERRYVLRLTDL